MPKGGEMISDMIPAVAKLLQRRASKYKTTRCYCNALIYPWSGVWS